MLSVKVCGRVPMTGNRHLIRDNVVALNNCAIKSENNRKFIAMAIYGAWDRFRCDVDEWKRGFSRLEPHVTSKAFAARLHDALRP